MSQTPPYEPESALWKALQQKAQEFQQISESILAQANSHQPDTLDFPGLSQLILRRGQLLHELTQAPLGQLSAAQQQALQQQMEACQALDTPIETTLRTMRDKLDKQINSLQSSKALISHYKIADSSESGTRSQDA